MEGLPNEFSEVLFSAAKPMGGWPPKFAVVTAHNPDGVLTDGAENDRADELLRDELVRSNLIHFRVVGGSRDGKHQEAGWGIEVNEILAANRLSKRFGQLAFFWITEGQLFLVNTKTGKRQFQAVWIERLLNSTDSDQ